MKNTLLKSAVGAALLGVSALTLAASPSSTASGSAMSSGEGFYVLGQAGALKFSAKHTDFSDNWGLAGRLAAGYLWSSDAWRFGVEAGALIHDFNTYSTKDDDGTKDKVNTSGYLIDLLAVGKYYFNDQWNIFGKAGAAYVQQKLTVKENGVKKGTFKAHNIRPEIQAGIGYDVNQNLGFSLTYLYAYGKRDQTNEKNNLSTFPVHAVMAGVEYHIV